VRAHEAHDARQHAVVVDDVRRQHSVVQAQVRGGREEVHDPRVHGQPVAGGILGDEPHRLGSDVGRHDVRASHRGGEAGEPETGADLDDAAAGQIRALEDGSGERVGAGPQESPVRLGVAAAARLVAVVLEVVGALQEQPVTAGLEHQAHAVSSRRWTAG
jgi:hypothetical protein